MKNTNQPKLRRVILIVMDSCGCGAANDATSYGDAGSNTLGHVSQALPGFSLPHFAKLGLGNITPMIGVPVETAPVAAWGRMQEASPGKDTTTGHWEMSGLLLKKPFLTFPHGFSQEMMTEFSKRIGREILGNYAASGTTIIEDLGAEHMKTGRPIVYTSADSVFQVAAHEDIISLEELYKICEIARELCNDFGVARVIARPFIGQPGAFKRTYNRRDFSLTPTEETVLDRLQAQQIHTIGIGKIWDIFAGKSVVENIHTEGNKDGLEKVLEVMSRQKTGLIFCNLVDFDMVYGHRRDAVGYAHALQEMDGFLPLIQAQLEPGDLLLLTADHGNDPTFPGSDHTREDVPLLACMANRPQNAELGIREGFFDIAQTLCDGFGLAPWARGKSILGAFTKSLIVGRERE